MRTRDRFWRLWPLFAAACLLGCADDKKNEAPHASPAGGSGGASVNAGAGGLEDSGERTNGGAADDGSNGSAAAASAGRGGSGVGGTPAVGDGGAQASAGAAGVAGGEGGEGGEAGAAAGPPECGNGRVEAGEACDPPSSATCSEACEVVSTSACVECEAAGACQSYSTACFDYFASDDERSICYAVLKCVRDSGCARGVHAVQECFCGDMSTAECSAAPATGAGSPSGACAGVIREGMSENGEVASGTEVLNRLIDESFPAGVALARVNCDRADPACINLCGY